jgi:hypothetical protein
MNALLSDVYYQPRRRKALFWALQNLEGPELAEVYYHARSVPVDFDLINRIGEKLQRRPGIGQLEPASTGRSDPPPTEPGTTHKPPPLAPGAPPQPTHDKPAPKEEPEMPALWPLFATAILVGLIWIKIS